jgi:hypothetical protein
MPGPVHCRSCGALLLEGTDATGVTLVGGEYIRFKRKTDYVVCPECMAVYPAEDLLADDATFEEEETDVEKLERMIEETKPAEDS